jgi:hypothetical protein
MILFVVFKAVLVGILFGGLIFAVVSARSNPGKKDVSQEQLDSQSKPTHKKSPSKIIPSVKMMIKFIFTCFIVMGLLVIPFALLKIIL